MKTIINIKADKEVKVQAMQTAERMGLPLSTVINAFLKKFIADQSVTFNAPLNPNRNLAKILKQSEKSLRKGGKDLSPLFVNMHKMDKYLASL